VKLAMAGGMDEPHIGGIVHTPLLLRYHMVDVDQDFRFGILIGLITHQFASFWHTPVRFPIQLVFRGV
jgi:hypothetical protein